jgi:hypothetical protein
VADLRELILQRLQDTVLTVAPGVTFFFPDGMTHAPLVNNLGGRVYNKLRAESRISSDEMPFAEIINDPSAADTIEPGSDDDHYYATTNVKIWGYAYGEDAADGLNSPLRAQLNSLRADLIIAVSAFPFWSGPNPAQSDALYTGVAPGTSVVLTSQWTFIAPDTPTGVTVLEFAIRYPFNKRFP